jgi:hypothetical protein
MFGQPVGYRLSRLFPGSVPALGHCRRSLGAWSLLRRTSVSRQKPARPPAGPEYRCKGPLGLDRGNFFHTVYSIEESLGQAFRVARPCALYPQRVDAWRAAQAVKRAAKTNAKIRVYQTDHAGATTQQIADGLGMAYDAILKALKRIRTKAELTEKERGERLNANHTDNGLVDDDGLRTSQVTGTNRFSGRLYDPSTDFRDGGPYPLPEGSVQARFIGSTSYPGRHNSWWQRSSRMLTPRSHTPTRSGVTCHPSADAKHRLFRRGLDAALLTR